MPGRDTRTRWQGVFARHREGCAVERLPAKPPLADVNRACSCEPSYYGKAYDRGRRRHSVTKRQASPAAARGVLKELRDQIKKGALMKNAAPHFRDARVEFVEAAREGKALNKHGRVYKKSAIKDIDECLRKHALPHLGARRLDEVRRGDIQALVDDLAPHLSGSRVRSIVNAVRSLYRWAQERDLASEDPAERVRLPALEEQPRERIASPAEFAQLLAALSLEDALPYALAAFGMGRRAQIQRLRWRDLDLKIGLIDWGVEAEARKSRAARRVVPTVKPLLSLLRRSHAAQGEPAGEKLVCPPRRASKSGILHTRGLADKAHIRWKAHGLEPIGLQECRHTAATWLDAAGVSPRVASELMGHSTPALQAGAAPITLGRYTHVMPDAIETARRQMDEWLGAQLAKKGD